MDRAFEITRWFSSLIWRFPEALCRNLFKLRFRGFHFQGMEAGGGENNLMEVIVKIMGLLQQPSCEIVNLSFVRHYRLRSYGN